MNEWRDVAAVTMAAGMLAATGCARAAHSHVGIEDEELPVGSLTRWTERVELYLQNAPLVAGRTLRFAVSVTELEGFAPLGGARVAIAIEGPGGVERLEAEPAEELGVYFAGGVVAEPGEYRWRLEVDAPGVEESLDLGAVTVHSDVETARAAWVPPAPSATFPKLAQWASDFATAPVAERELRLSLSAPAVVRPGAGAEAVVSAPADGRYAGRLPPLGSRVAAGEMLGVLEPRLAGLELSTLEADVAARRTEAIEARTEAARAELLLAERAVPARFVDRARHDLTVARAELRAAEVRLQHRRQTLAEGGSSAGSNAYVLRSPLAGSLVEVTATPGVLYEAGAPLFRVVATDPVVVEVQLPEPHAHRADAVGGAVLELPGEPEPLELQVRAVRHPGVIDPQTHALPVWLEVRNPNRRLLIGQAGTAALRVGGEERLVAIPVSAVVADAGRDVVFVQTGGESFERRPVRLGQRDRDLVGVVAGLEAGERIVTHGAYDVLLATALPSRPAEAHVH